MSPTPSPLRPALFLDRDGVINEEVGYLSRWEDCRLVEGIVPLVQTANRLGLIVCVITNQSGIARGLYSEADFHGLMAVMAAAFHENGAKLDAVYFSPFHPVHGVGEYRRETDCRKPGPGMLLRAAAEHPIDLKRSLLVGDRCSDLEAGRSAGLSSLFLFGTTEPAPCASNLRYSMVGRLSAVEAFLLATYGQQTC